MRHLKVNAYYLNTEAPYGLYNRQCLQLLAIVHLFILISGTTKIHDWM